MRYRSGEHAEELLHLLRPLGVPEVPASIEEAIAAYRAARDRLEAELGVTVSRRLEREVLRVVPA